MASIESVLCQGAMSALLVWFSALHAEGLELTVDWDVFEDHAVRVANFSISTCVPDRAAASFAGTLFDLVDPKPAPEQGLRVALPLRDS
jgi:hypothetical protein